MAQNFGIPSHRPNTGGPHRAAARYLVLIDAGGEKVARLFDAGRRHLADVDAGTEEVAVMTRGLHAAPDAGAPEWNDALAGHSAAEREAAEVYTLDV